MHLLVNFGAEEAATGLALERIGDGTALPLDMARTA